MSLSTWLIHDATPASLGVVVAGGEFRSGSANF
jgi:hypothetical protein